MENNIQMLYTRLIELEGLMKWSQIDCPSDSTVFQFVELALYEVG